MMMEENPTEDGLTPQAPHQIPPAWTKDNLAYFCGYCHKEFGMLLRKHHCRHCGKVFCDECTRFRAKIPQMGIDEMVRICEYCRRDAQGLIGTESMQRPSEVKKCVQCAKGFGVVGPSAAKHNCQHCGKVFCADCTRWFAKIAHLGYDKEYVRVCETCKDLPNTFSRLYEWQRDSDVTACNECLAEFTRSFRRHHCRHCGKIFCSKCLKAKALVLGDPKPQKICNACSTSGSSDLKVVK
eukprot:CAMPEP_0174293896 /NCGR_PEP_ID=MMETSP0809-20121228/40036_1 /TAXON_ID=73025 ORGANISM="Eutreptiella gymnastica-like, Strain CCMP1594" /NCGR_SAMPLE_ID=MMETSP0809 /ASSEMBLY_ACC=CAM_ASM_000658 /LENGTH=238 /DNA_ID=CAMNT_0015394993 /DNA_START=29 /DNA_END=745 /DNA_ORIENTATION=+